MRIEQILPSRLSKRTCLLSLEDNTTFVLLRSDIKRYGLKAEHELSPSDLQELLNESDAYVKQQTLAMLAKRSYAKEELKRALVKKGANETQAESFAAWACQQGFIDEEEYARRVIEECSRKGYGIYRIKTELSRKAVPREMWEELLCEWTVDTEKIDMLLEKLLKSTDEAGYRKAGQALQRRGYSYEEIASAIRRNKERYDQ